MCTVSWYRFAGGYGVFMNRDEQRSRAEGEPPARRRDGEGEPAYLAPRDPEGGGTWAFVNAAGVSGVILNYYSGTSADAPPAAEARSRGRLLADLATAGSVAEFRRRLGAEVRRAPYRPFRILAMEPEGGAGLYQWSGGRLRKLRPRHPFQTTSSRAGRSIQASRLHAFRRTVADPRTPAPEELERLHSWHAPGDGARSCLMSRPDARTVSRLHIRVDSNAVEMRYRPVRPTTPPECAAATVRRLERIGADGSRVDPRGR